MSLETQRARLLGLALVLLPACNALLGAEKRSLDDDLETRESGDATSSKGNGGPDSVEDGGIELEASVGSPDAGPDSTKTAKVPNPACVRSTSPKSALKRVEIDSDPLPIVSGEAFTAFFSVYADNAQTDIQLDFCTADGLTTNVGGGLSFLGGGGDVTRRWQTKSAVTLPVGRVQAQVVADDPSGNPELKLVYELTLQ